MRYFISDTRFGHNTIHLWERHQFSSTEEHDNYLVSCFEKWAMALKDTDELWVLGDWGDISFLSLMDNFKCKTCFVYGNHDAQADLKFYKEHFDEVYLYPVYLSQKLVVSHYPVAVYDDTINIHGHLHGMGLKDDNHISVSINDMKYKLFKEQALSGTYQRIKPFDRHFLWEPWTGDCIVFDPNREDVIFNPVSGELDTSATIAYKKLMGTVFKVTDPIVAEKEE